MMRATLVLLLVSLAGGLEEAHAARFLAPKFGRPVLVGDNLVFAEPGREPHRLICITKEAGKKLWEIKDAKQRLQIWLLGKQLLVAVGGDINDCDPLTGKLTVLHRTRYSDVILKDLQDGHVLAQGEKDGTDYISYLEVGSWRIVWEVPRITLVIAPGQEVLLCEQGTRKPTGGGGYSLVDQRWVALSRKDGRISWSQAPFAQAAAIDSYFMVYLKDTIYCLAQRDGTTIKQFRIRQTPYAQLSFASRGQQLLVNTFEFSGDASEKRAFFSLTVPGLDWGKLTQSEWDSAVRAQNDVRDDHYVYFSSIAPDSSETSITREEIKTGKREELYREPVPAELRRKRTDQLQQR